MANLGAQILAGSPKADHAVINPTHYIFLSKSDSPVWMLVDENNCQEAQRDFPNMTWIQTIGHVSGDTVLIAR
jgi:hypothetical protein